MWYKISMKRLGILLIATMLGAQVYAASEVALDGVQKETYKTSPKKTKISGSLLINDKKMLEELIKLQKEKDLADIEILWKGTIENNKVIEFAKDVLDKNELYEQWSFNRDGASLICRMLFEEATDINFYVGRAVNPAHQNPELPITFNIKMNLVEELSACLKQMGKRIKVSYS